MFRKFLLTAVVAVTAALVAPATSQAQFVVTISDGANLATADYITVTVTATTAKITSAGGNLVGLLGTDLDGAKVTGANFSTGAGGLFLSPGNDGATIYGSTSKITFEGATFNIVGGGSNYTGTAVVGEIDISLTNLNQNTTTKTLIASVMETGFLAPTTPFATLQTTVDTLQPQTLPTTVTGSGSYDNGVATVSATIPSGQTGTSATSGSFPLATPYSLSAAVSLVGTIKTGPSGVLTNTGAETDLIASPAPSGLILAATMVPFFGLLRRRLRQTVAPVVA